MAEKERGRPGGATSVSNVVGGGHGERIAPVGSGRA